MDNNSLKIKGIYYY